MGEDRKLNFVERRRDICDKCEHLTTMIGVKVCNKCGCAIWGKTIIPISKCPEGKWNAE
jgi:hypothetical protein